MEATIRRSEVSGTAAAPPSKSYTHRAILAAGYGEGATVRRPLRSADTRATTRVVEAFGGTVDGVDAGAETETGTGGGSGPPPLEVTGFEGHPAVPEDVVDCANSGTTMRLATAAAALAPGTTVLTGDASLRSRPQGPLLDAVESLGGRAESTRANGQAPLVVGGPVEGGSVSIPGDVSSQFVTALLMAGAVTDDGIEVALETPLKSAPYVDITLDVLSAFGVESSKTADGYRVAGGQGYAPEGGAYAVPGDFSSLSYLLAAGAVAGAEGVTAEGAVPSAQGDAAIVDHLDRMGASVEWDREDGTVTVERSALSGIAVDVGDTPDLLPTLATLGAVADGVTRIENCEHVRYKETDRVAAMAEALSRMGAVVEESQGELVVRGGESDLTGTRLDGRGDHRIVMALSVAGLVADGETTITGAEDVDVSFPGFFETLSSLGADVETAPAGD